MKNTIVCGTATFKPGDSPPKGYLEWEEWARVQYKAGLRQQFCGDCRKWLFPSEREGHPGPWLTKLSKVRP